jgi:hypothetical protein
MQASQLIEPIDWRERDLVGREGLGYKKEGEREGGGRGRS